MKKVPYKSKMIVIYGIYSVSKKTIIKVDLSLKNIENEFDLSMYSDKAYKICRLEVAI